jgi:hypothetical protein
MTPFLVLAAILVALVLFDLATLRWGTDSRPGPNDRRDWW